MLTIVEINKLYEICLYMYVYSILAYCTCTPKATYMMHCKQSQCNWLCWWKLLQFMCRSFMQLIIYLYVCLSVYLYIRVSFCQVGQKGVRFERHKTRNSTTAKNPAFVRPEYLVLQYKMQATYRGSLAPYNWYELPEFQAYHLHFSTTLLTFMTLPLSFSIEQYNAMMI